MNKYPKKTTDTTLKTVQKPTIKSAKTVKENTTYITSHKIGFERPKKKNI